MSIASTTRKAGPYTGNGSTTVFPFSFKVFQASDLVITQTNTSGVDVVLTLTTDYTVSLNANQDSNPGGSITCVSAPASGYKITITSNVLQTQPVVLTNMGGFYPSVINDALDRLTIFCQQILEKVSRTLTLPVSVVGVSTTLPAPIANNLIAWNENASGLQSLDAAGLASVVAFGTAKADIFSGNGSTTQFTLTASPGAQNNLDVSISGVTQKPGIDYTWVSGTIITFTSAPPVGTNNVLVRYLQGLPQGYTDSAASTFIQSGTGAVSRTSQDKMRETVSVKDFGAKGDGVTDDTAAITTAISASVAVGKSLFFPAGTYITSGIAAITNMSLVGEGATQTIIKLKNSTNSGLITSSSSNIDDVYISNIRFDGNSSNNSAGDTLTIKGARPTFINVQVINSAGNGIVTDWNSSNGARVTGCCGFFSNIIIDSSQQSGWIHNGASDCHFENILIIDAGLKTNNTYYGIHLVSGSGNGRFFNLHPWNRNATTNVPLASVYVASNGNNFTNCHFEGGTTSLIIAGSGNTFAACSAYAPRGTHTVSISGIVNTLQMALGLGAASSNPTYKGVLLNSTTNNILDLNNSGGGCTLGAVDFTGDSGQNNVRLVGWQATGSAYTGTPNAATEVSVFVSGPAGTIFVQNAAIAWTATTPTITSGTGTFTTVSAAGRYQQSGKKVFFTVKVTITTNGTAASYVVIPLPVAPNTSTGFAVSGRADGVSGKALQAKMVGSNLNVFNYDGTYPGANGEILIVSGSYEAA